RYSSNGTPDFGALRGFYRLLRAPGFDHCGGQQAASGAFDALVRWVEQGTAPESLVVSGGPDAAVPGRSRPICVYPQTAIYKGSGSVEDANNFRCGGNLETHEVICGDVLAKYQHEKDGSLDFSRGGTAAQACRIQPP